jgi:protein-S-isoprenylcysteine O-methyltransferase Ste14
MANLRRNILVYLAALLTVSQMLLADVVDGRRWEPLRYLAPVVGVIGFGLICAAMFTLHRRGGREPGGSYMQATRLVDRGPFAVVRHPQYLGYICLNVTFVLISQRWPIIALGSLATALFCLVALREEELLIEKFGREYREYTRRVPRFNMVLGLVRAALRWRPGQEPGESAQP